MNKKKYMQPTSLVLNFEAPTLLAGSNPGYNPSNSFSDESSVGSNEFDFEEEF